MGFLEREVPEQTFSLKEALYVRDLPNIINLGHIAQIANDLRKKTQKYPWHKEEVIIEQEPILFEKRVDNKIQGNGLLKNEVFITIIRSELTESPLSVNDIIPILNNRPGETNCILKATPKNNSLLVPGEQTLTQNQGNTFTFIIKRPENKCPDFHKPKYFGDLMKKIPLEGTIRPAYEQMRMEVSAEMQLVKNIVEKCGINVFRGSAKSQKVTRVPA